MIKAEEVKEGDLVVIKHSQKYIEIDKKTEFMIKSTDVNIEYKSDLTKLNLLDRNFTQQELEIMARLLGANITDGNLYHKENRLYNCSFYLGEKEDTEDLIKDIMTLGFSTPYYRQKTTKFVDKLTNKTTIYNIHIVDKSGVFAYFLKLIGAFVGKKTNQIIKLPQWIIEANKPIIREFLSAFFSGDNAKLTVSYRKKKNKYDIVMHPLHQNTYCEYLQSTIEYITSISKLLDKFDIKTQVLYNKLKDNNKYQVDLIINKSLDNLNTFVDIIGFRYCHEKQRKSIVPIEYIKCKKYIIDQQTIKFQKVIDMNLKGIKNSEIAQLLSLDHTHVYQIIKRSGEKIIMCFKN